MALSVGSTVGRYQIHGLLGSGGMGEVYKAADPTLGRTVALKVLRPELSGDPERLSRFLHEARAASALNHPNILTIHEVGDHDRSRFLVSELVEGETLRERVARGNLTVREILDITIQAASALAAAHAASIVHRDIKPDNLMLRPDGYVKVLDFGVATFARSAGSADAMATMAHETGDGMIVGTIAYMSPEQARGLPVDGRSDCYSLGVVLYELVTGRAPFSAPTTTDLLVAILEREPPSIRSVAKGLPLQLEWIIEKALEKDPNLRYQTISDLRVDLQRLKSALESGKLAAAAADATPAADAVVERQLTDDSPEVAAKGSISWLSLALGAAAAMVLGVAMSFYHAARPGADLPLQLPEGGVVTKARDAIQGFGYKDIGSNTDTEFATVLSVDAIVRSAGLPAAREAIREGGPVAQWRAGIGRSGSSSANDMEPDPGNFSVRFDPKGQLAAFATGYSTEGTIAHVDRATSTSIALEAIRKSYGVDASNYDLEVVERAFPAGKTELTYRSRELSYGHVQQFRVNLQGERLILIERTYQRPRGYVAPETPLPIRVYTNAGPFVLIAFVVIGWAFGLYFLFKHRNWDALTRRLPVAMCVLVIVQVGLQVIGNSGVFESLLGVTAVTLFLIGVALPALSGIFLWIGRRSPDRMWAAEQLTIGRWRVPAVSASLVDGIAAGAIMAAIGLLGDWGALQIPGIEPSISRELNAVDASFGSMLGDTLSSAAFIVLGIALAIETLEHFRLHPLLSTVIVAAVAGLAGANDQTQVLPTLPLVAAMAAIGFIIVTLYKRRGFLAAWIAGMAQGWLTTAMALRSLEDPELSRLSGFLIALVVVIALAGAWGAGRKLWQRPATA
jgi:hypothetical protein